MNTGDQSVPVGTAPDPADALLGLLEQLAEHSRVPFDRIVARRAMNEAARAFPGPEADRPITWLIEAGRAVGLRIARVRLTLKRATEVVRPSDPVAIIHPDDESCHFVLLERAWGNVRVWSERTHWMPVRRLARRLGLRNEKDEIDCILIEPTAAYPLDEHARPTDDHAHGHHHAHPIDRLRAFIRTEWNDLWVVLVFAVTVGVFSLATPIAVEGLVTIVMFGSVIQPLIVVAGTLFLFLFASAAMKAAQTFVMEILQQRIFVRVVDDLAYRLPRLATRQIDDEDGPVLVNRFFETVSLQKNTAFLFLDGTAIVIQMVVGMAILGFYHPWLLGFDLFLLTMILVVVFWVGRNAIHTAIDESIAKYDSAAWLQDLARCRAAFKLAGAPSYAYDRADELAKLYVRRRSTHFRILWRQILFVLMLEAVVSTVLLGLGGWLVIRGQMTLGQLVAAELIVTMIVGSVAKLGKHFELYYDMLAAFDKLGHIFDLPIEPVRGQKTLARAEPASVSLRDVHFHEHGGANLGPWSGEIHAGERVAIVGSPGSGKSTLADLLFANVAATTGNVIIDGLSLRDVHRESLRRDVALVRDIEIVPGTVAANVHLGRGTVLAADVRRGLERARLWDELHVLPEGLETPLRRSGSPLTGSQRVRLMLARALAGRPRLLVVDAVLDTLPSHLLTQIAASLSELDSATTVVLITTRPELQACCQRMLTLDAEGSDAAVSLMTPGGHA